MGGVLRPSEVLRHRPQSHAVRSHLQNFRDYCYWRCGLASLSLLTIWSDVVFSRSDGLSRFCPNGCPTEYIVKSGPSDRPKHSRSPDISLASLWCRLA